MLTAIRSGRKLYGGINTEDANSVRQTTDHGYIIVGTVYTAGSVGFKVHLIKTDATGDTLWTKTYGGTSYDYGYEVQQTNDSGYIITGYTASFGAGAEDVYLIKTNATGDTLWTQTYGGTDDDDGYSMQQTTDGGYIITGYTSSFGSSPDGSSVYIIKTDANGNSSCNQGATNSVVGYDAMNTASPHTIVSSAAQQTQLLPLLAAEALMTPFVCMWAFMSKASVTAFHFIPTRAGSQFTVYGLQLTGFATIATYNVLGESPFENGK